MFVPKKELDLSPGGGIAGSPVTSALTHDDISEMLATLDFSEAQAVSDADVQLQAQALALFPASTFDGANAEGVGRALATLILFHWAGQRHQTTRWIEFDPDKAGETLSEHLTPTGQIDVLQSHEGSHGENAFSRYLAEVDRCCLAGRLYCQRADREVSAGGPGKAPGDVSAQAAEDYRKAVAACGQAAELFTQTHQHRRAIDVSLMAADAYQRAGETERAVAAYLQAADAVRADADAHPAQEKYARATEAYRRAVRLYTVLGQPESAAAAEMKAAHAARADADACPDERWYGLAAASYLRAAGRYQDLKQHEPVADACLWAADLFTRAHEPEKALAAYRRAADANLEAGRYGLAGDALRRVADLHAELGRPGRASQAHDAAAAAYRSAADGAIKTLQRGLAGSYALMSGYAAEAASEYAQAVRAFNIAGQRQSDAQEAFALAAAAFREQGLREAAIEAYVMAKLYPKAIKLCKQVISEYLAAGERLQAAEACMVLGGVLAEAGTREDASKAYFTAAALYQREGDVVAAALASARGGDPLPAIPIFARENRPAYVAETLDRMGMEAQASRAYLLASRTEMRQGAQMREAFRARANEICEAEDQRSALTDRNL